MQCIEYNKYIKIQHTIQYKALDKLHSIQIIDCTAYIIQIAIAASTIWQFFSYSLTMLQLVLNRSNDNIDYFSHIIMKETKILVLIRKALKKGNHIIYHLRTTCRIAVPSFKSAGVGARWTLVGAGGARIVCVGQGPT